MSRRPLRSSVIAFGRLSNQSVSETPVFRLNRSIGKYISVSRWLSRWSSWSSISHRTSSRALGERPRLLIHSRYWSSWAWKKPRTSSRNLSCLSRANSRLSRVIWPQDARYRARVPARSWQRVRSDMRIMGRQSRSVRGRGHRK